MLLTIEDVQAIPGGANLAARPIIWVNRIVGAADRAVKRYCKRDLELSFYTDLYSGNQQRDFIANQFPLWVGQTTVAGGSGGQTLPQATINVASTSGFHPGLGGAQGVDILKTPGIAVQTGLTTYSYVNYTGTTATSFTGCTGGTGTMGSGVNNNVFSPVVWFDPGAFSGQAPNAFAPNTLQTMGTQFYVPLDKGASRRRSERGLVERMAGQGAGTFGFWPAVIPFSGKLAAAQLPIWQRGDRNIKMAFAAGYGPYDNEMQDLNYAAVMVAAQMIRIQPKGANLQSESLGAYNYNTVITSDNPEMAEVRRILAPYRESSFSS